MDLWKSLSGMLSIEFTSATPEKTLDAMVTAGIQIFRVVPQNELTYQILVRRSDYRQITSILLKRRETMKIVRKNGIFWKIKRFVHHPILLNLFLLLFLSSLFLPSRIFFITVDGNSKLPDRMILSAAEECGITFGASRKLVRSEKTKNALLSAIPQLQWAGVNTYGCTAVISVRERAEEARQQKKIATNIVADRDGYILSATVTGGTAHFLPGESVTKGQLLISGYTDCGICIRASKAEGEIVAQTNREITACIPDTYLFPDRTDKVGSIISLIIGKKRINLWKDSRISDTGCGRMYEEYYFSLPGGFQLPIGISVDQYSRYTLQEHKALKTDARILLNRFSETYLLQQMIAGKISKTQQIFFTSAGLYVLESSYTCTEMIGIEQREQIGVINGKRS